MTVHKDRATTIALLAVAHIVEDERLITEFAGESGLDPADFRTSLGDQSVLAAVLGFVLGDERRAARFAGVNNLGPEEAFRAWQMLSGDDRVLGSI